VKAIRQYALGGPEVLGLEDVADPVPGEGQVRIAVEAAGVHLVDTFIRRGEGPPHFSTDLPMIPGREVAGTIDTLGSGVDAPWLGQRVVAHLGMASGGYAELAVAPVASLHRLPDEVDADTAVTMIGTGRTAVAILDQGTPASGDVVLVTAAAGGLGVLLVQAARAAGSTVVGAAGGDGKVALARSLGADVAVDYSEAGWADAVRDALGDRQVTLVLDGVGGDIGRAALELADLGGRIVLYGGSSGSWTEISTDDVVGRGLTISSAIGPRLLQREGGLRPLETRALRLAAEGTVKPVVTSFALADAAAAHVALETRATRGKVVLNP
jgi:NADPH2:quinone reductase